MSSENKKFAYTSIDVDTLVTYYFSDASAREGNIPIVKEYM